MISANAITHWIGYLSRSICACRDVWSAAAMLPRQPRSRSGACHAADPTGFIKVIAHHQSHPTTSSTPSRCASAGFLGTRASGSHPWKCAPLKACALPARYARVATFGVRQPYCRASRAHNLARGIPFPILVTGVLNVLMPIIESVMHTCDTWA